MVARVNQIAGSYLKIHARLASSSLGRRVGNADYFSSFEIHEKMLADRRRIEAYCQAIAKYVKEGDVVVDLGTGTGILAFLAHAHKPGKIYAIDHSSIIRHAGVVADSNELRGIEFVKQHSKSFRPKQKVDVIIQEQMGSWIFNEDMVDSMLDLRNRILKRGGRILPNRFEVFFEPAQLKPQSVVPLIWENHINGVDFSCLEKVRHSRKITPLMLQPHDIETLLAEPQPLVSFDLESLESARDIPRHWLYGRTAVVSGQLHGFVLYFKAFFDESIVVDTTPVGPHECLAQRRLPFYRARTEAVAEGDRFAAEVRLGNLTKPNSWKWSYSVARGDEGRS